MKHEMHAGVTFAVATALEQKALRRALPRARIVRTGIALRDLDSDLGDVVVSCGLAGALRADLRTGTVLIPRRVCRPDGEPVSCDAALVALFTESARRLGLTPVGDPLLTAPAIVRGTERATWASRGFAGVDMETGRIDAPRIAAVRVVLDTPAREISADWERPVAAMLKPWNWPQALWLAREGPRAAALVAEVVAGAQGIPEWLRISRQ